MAIILLKRKLGKLLFILLALLASTNVLYELNKSFRTKKQKTDSSAQPFIFIGGFGRSGTTLMRAILDVHPDIKCGPETKVIPTFVRYAVDWKKRNGANLNRDLENAGIRMKTIDSGIANFITHIMENRGFKAPRLCAKDPDVIYFTEYLHSIFPKAKFIYMVRDGRAAAYSYMLQINELMNFKKYKSYIFSWANFNRKVSSDCKRVGNEFCLQIRYEDLILHPEKTLRRVSEFLGVKWTDELLKHQDHIGSKIAVSKTEWSSHQIVKPINTESLYSWVGKIELDLKQLKPIEPVLAKFNYSFNISAPRLDKADLLVVKNNQLIKENKDYWDIKGKNYSEHVLNLEERQERMIRQNELLSKSLGKELVRKKNKLDREQAFIEKYQHDFDSRINRPSEKEKLNAYKNSNLD